MTQITTERIEAADIMFVGTLPSHRGLFTSQII